MASLLPGLRDLRVPLAAGFLWLLVLWQMFYQIIPTEKLAVGLVAEIYRLTSAFGPAALTAGISFVAYLIGILVAPASTRFGEKVARAILLDPSPHSTEPVSISTYEQAMQLAQATSARAERAGVELSIEGDVIMPMRNFRPLRGSAALLALMQEEIPLVATRLLAHNRELFDRYDRADAEAAFRFVIFLPLLITSILIPLRLGLPWWGYLISISAGLTIAVLLLIDGYRKQVESNDAVYQAVFIGEVSFPSIENVNARIQEAQVRGQQRPRR